MVWRDARRMSTEFEPPEPFPSRVEAFVTACAMHAGQRERDLVEALEGLSAEFAKK